MKYRQPVSMPSSVSTWLNEQLEARGIDSEVYTRYILSLLHANTLDILHPEEDDFLEIKKEGRRNAVSHRRFRRASIASTLWWRHARFDADQIKRSAAVKCLKSAADQNCEIESLVNELCEKLKEADAPSKADIDSDDPDKSKKIQSFKELAEKYYAAFPPLRPAEQTVDVTPVCQLSKYENSAWLSSEKTLVEPAKPLKNKSTPQKKLASPKKLHSLNNHSNVNGNNNNKKKHQYPKSKNKMDSFRGNNKSFQGHHRGGGQYRHYTKEQKEQIKQLEKEMMENFNNWQFLNNFSLEDRDQCLEPSNATLPDDQGDIDMYDSLPVNLSNLLDDSNESHVDMMNSVNIRQSSQKHNFIPYGTNIVSSIWSNEDSSGLKSDVELALDFEFGAISIDGNQKNSWPDFKKQNEENHFLEQNANNSSVFAGFRSQPTEGAKSDFSSTLTENNECLFDMLTISLMKINHNKERSGFTPVVPRSQTFSKPFNPFGDYPNPTVPLKPVPETDDKEDLLTSEKSHFKPIKETEKPKAYQDGASFVINGNLDKVEYKLSPSGSTYLEQEFGQLKKYREYRCTNEPELGTDDDDDKARSPFVPKFCMDQNDIGCQTDGERRKSPLWKTAKCADLSNLTDYEDDFDVDGSEMSNCTCDVECACIVVDDGSKKDMTFGKRRDSIVEEVSWPRYQAKSCDKCNNNNDANWNMDWLNGTGQNSWKNTENSKNIWNGGEVCQACLRLNGGHTPQTDQHTKLKEDIFQDGEQLLSDISSLQKSYMEMSMPIEFVALEPLSDKRKRRHSYIDNATDDVWGFATRFQEDGLFKMLTFPTLRSVTL